MKTIFLIIVWAWKLKKPSFGKLPYQKIQVIDSYLYGKVLLLDDIVQTTEKDEFMYHEMLIHPALLTHPQPEKILIVGGRWWRIKRSLKTSS